MTRLQPSQGLCLVFRSIGTDHAEVTNKKGVVSIKPGPNAKDIMVNGEKIVSEKKLSHNDRWGTAWRVFVVRVW